MRVICDGRLFNSPSTDSSTALRLCATRNRCCVSDNFHNRSRLLSLISVSDPICNPVLHVRAFCSKSFTRASNEFVSARIAIVERGQGFGGEGNRGDDVFQQADEYLITVELNELAGDEAHILAIISGLPSRLVPAICAEIVEFRRRAGQNVSSRPAKIARQAA